MNQNSVSLAKEWFGSAISDYNYAQVGLKEKQIFPQIAFLSQQIAEKFLKGFLIINGVKPTRIHELPKILDECIEINKELEKLRDACELLTGFYVETRYPPDIPEYTKEEIVEAFEKATLIKETIEQLVNHLSASE